jgi:hypothetical protein
LLLRQSQEGLFLFSALNRLKIAPATRGLFTTLDTKLAVKPLSLKYTFFKNGLPQITHSKQH